MQYRYEATSEKGFVQQLATNILTHGYYFYVQGYVPEGKDPREIDKKLMTKYGVEISRSQRARRKLSGLANVHYLRFERRWILLATHGDHLFKVEEAKNIRDVREHPIQAVGYSQWVKRGNFLKRGSGDDVATPDGKYRVRVLISREAYRDLRAYFLAERWNWSVERLSAELRLIPYEPYAPVRKQLLKLLFLINQKRRTAGYNRVPADVFRYRRDIVKVFEPVEEGTQRQAA
ncbi:MAG TPA: hypothetical protein VFE46_01690 [Pirellulales bacterium]|nr:hypothetical protein [Pirellulales bacterium]